VRYNTISQLGAFTAFDDASTDYLLLDPSKCSGGADPPLRTTVEPAPGADGALLFPPLDDAQIITLAGVFIVNSSGYFTATDTLLASLKSALDALKAAPDALVHSGGTLQVWKYAPIDSSWQDGRMEVTFGLVVDVFA
jgi:hypothetical protein